jgi:prepilin-type N-terminal cleavage/methylation domain-containing protein
MIYRSHRKRGSYLNSALTGGSKVQGPRSRVQEPGDEIRGRRFDEGGFTLIEVIAALIIIAVLAAMLFPVTNGQWRMARGVGECRDLFELQGEMEKIVAAYKNELSDDGDVDLGDFRTALINGYPSVDSNNTNFIDDSGGDLELTGDPTSLLLVTLGSGDQRLATIFSSK